MKRVLVIAPHPDDEVLGCGGLMARCVSEGNEVFVCVASNHDAPIYTPQHKETTKREAREAHAVLGVRETVFLDYAAVTLNRVAVHEFNGAMNRVVRDISPDTVLIPHAGDIHIDHQIVAKAALVAMRPLADCGVQTILAYETLSETEWNAPRAEYAFMPNYFVDISGYLERKLEAMGCFVSQLHPPPHPRSLRSLETLARMRGSAISADAAEAFTHIRTVWRA
ncbi:MAG TPA: PIG-L deacetylase family protein [Feifaniaceae bacterium]|nr:PIG-L deacetylase family protein [Feifaniaceae bacterium]